MKTTKREASMTMFDLFSEPEKYDTKCARWKRKNRIAQYKRTISILKNRLKDTEETLRITQKITKCFIVKPDHWHHLDENGNELTRKQWRIKTKKEAAERKDQP